MLASPWGLQLMTPLDNRDGIDAPQKVAMPDVRTVQVRTLWPSTAFGASPFWPRLLPCGAPTRSLQMLGTSAFTMLQPTDNLGLGNACVNSNTATNSQILFARPVGRCLFLAA